MNQEEQKPTRGCFTYGCIAAAVLMLLVVMGGLVGMYYAKQVYRNFTDPAPTPLPVVQMEPAQLQKLQNRVDAFRDDVNYGRSKEPLTLTAMEVNALIQNEPDMALLKGKVFVTITNNQLRGKLSVPLEHVGLEIFRGRYLNADAGFDVAINNGVLRLIARDISVKGKPIPEMYQDAIRRKNLAAQINDEPNASVALGRLQELQVKDGKLLIYPKMQ